jgi:glucosamine--fructose-6-phosphate aminotransferase (isomerizing)
MLQEIKQQPEALNRTLREEVSKVASLSKFLAARDIRLIVLVARGSSDNAALFGKYLLEITSHVPVSLAAPSVHTLYHARLNLRNALVVGVSQSGEGTDINLVLENAKKAGAFTLGITNEPRSAMAGLVDETLLIRARQGAERGGHQDLYRATPHVSLLAVALQQGKGLDRARQLPELASRCLELGFAIQRLVERYRFWRTIAFVVAAAWFTRMYTNSLSS